MTADGSGPPEELARDDGLLRGAAAPPASMGSCHRFENIEYDELKGELRVAGQPVAMEPRPLRVLSELLLRVNEVVTKEELFDAVWEGRPTVDHVLANAISKLRSAMGEPGGSRIVTVPRVGYRLNGPVQRVDVAPQRTVLVPGQLVPGRETFVLDSVLGAGKRSEVWLARHAKLGHQKVFKFATTADSLRAIKREYTLSRTLKQQLSDSEYRGFVPVADANFSDSPYFLEFDYAGPDLLRWSEQPAWAQLPRAERLRLFVGLARQLALAHNAGVLHKDIKPANVLVRGAGDSRAWVLADFGSGQAVDPERLRQLGITALGLTASDVQADSSNEGTLMYVAPELLAGHAPTVQSDIYSLGVLLFQVLVGDLKRPLTTGWQREVDDDVLADDIARATEGQPEHRATSLLEWAAGLGRLEQRRAEQRQQQTARELMATQQRELALRSARRPWVVGALVTLALALVTSLVLFERERSARLMAKAQAERAQAINEFLNQDVLQQADASELAPGEPATMQTVLKRASDLAGQRFQGQPLTEASVRTELGRTQERMGNRADAELEFRRAFELLSQQHSPDDVQVLAAQLELANLLTLTSKRQESRALLQAAEAVLPPERLAAQPQLALLLAQTRQRSLRMDQKFVEAVEPTREWVRLLEGQQDTNTPAQLKERYLARRLLAENLWRAGQAQDAEAALALLSQPPLRDIPRSEVQRARDDLLLLKVQMANGRAGSGAQETLLRVIAVLQNRLGPDDGDAAAANLMLGGVYAAQADFAKAVAALEEARRAFTRSLGQDHPNTRIVSLNLALNRVHNGQPALALQMLLQERPYFFQKGGADSPMVQAIDFHVARALNVLSRHKEALDRLAPLKPELLAQGALTPGWNWLLQAERAWALLDSGQRDEGARLLRQAVEELTAVKAPTWWVDGHRARLRQWDQRTASR